MDLCRKSDKSVDKISRDYISSHGKISHGKSLGQYYIHGLGTTSDVNVHTPANTAGRFSLACSHHGAWHLQSLKKILACASKDDVLITETGYKLLSERCPATPAEIEKKYGPSRPPNASKNPPKGTIDLVESPVYTVNSRCSHFP